MKKFLVALIIILAVLALVFFVWYNFFHKAPHEHYSEDAETIVEACPDCVTDGAEYKICRECGEKFDVIVIPAPGHSLLAAVKEDEKAPDCTHEGSYKMVKRCSECDYSEFEVISIPSLGHSDETVMYMENVVAPTCYDDGSYDEVTYCTVCSEEIARTTVIVPKKVHNFNWTLTETEEGEMIPEGECTEEGCGHNFDPSLDTDFTYTVYHDEENSVEPTCVEGTDVYVAIIYYKGEELTRAVYEKEITSIQNHVLYGEDIFANPLRDDKGRIYYNLSTVGMYVVIDENQNEHHVWDAEGFALGMFKCSGCERWVAVRVYNDLAETE